jgi:hypothetical protein
VLLSVTAQETGDTALNSLSNPDFVAVQRFCQLMTEKVAGVGLDVFVESNFREYMRVRRELAPNAIYNPTYDPDYSDLSMHNSFWLRAVDPSGKTVCMIAQRVLDTDNFLDDIRTLRLWHDRGRPGVKAALDVLDCGEAEGLSGRVGHSGGLYIDHAWRKRNLSGLLDHLSRGLLLKNFWFDHITAFIVKELAATGIGVKQYGWPDVGGRVDFDFLTGGKVWNLVFCHMDRAEVLRRMRHWLLWADRDSIEELQEVRELLVG